MQNVIMGPESISRSTVMEFVESLGLDPHLVDRLTFTPNNLFVYMRERDENGKSLRDPDNSDELEIKTIKIPIEF